MHPNVKYELQELERLISLSQETTGFDETSELAFKDTIKVEVERIKQTFVHEVFSFEDERHLERYIQYHQQALIRLMDKVALLLGSASQPGKVQKAIYQIFYTGIEDLLAFVERHFTKYFDQDAKAPEGYIAVARKDAKSNIRKLHKGLLARNADSRIVDLLIRVLKKIMDSNPEVGITYRKVMYAKEVQKELQRLLEKDAPDPDLNEELRQIMYYLNYNSIKVITYHAHFVSSLLEQTETRAEKIEKLSYELKKINQAQVKPGIRYNQNAPSLKDQLSNYIAEEIDYQERLQKLSNESPDKPPPESFLPGFRLKFEASVSQLAFLLRIFIETKFLLNNNLTQLLQFVVKYVVTKRSEPISFGSLRSKFYSVESGTRESVRGMLASMISYIDRSY